MKSIKNLKILVLSIFLVLTLNIFGQNYQINTNGTVILGAVDVNGKPTQLLSEVVGVANARVIQVNAANVIIRNVIIDATGQNNGVLINGQANVIIDNVIVRNANQSGIFSNNATNIIIRNSETTNNSRSQNISNNYWPGVNLYASEPNAFSTQNGVRDIAYAGIFVQNSAGFLIQANASYGNNGHGIKILQNNNVPNGRTYSGQILDNVVGAQSKTAEPDGNFGDGILVTNSNYVLIDGNISVANGNRIAWNGLTGIASVASQGLDNRNFYGAGIELNQGGNHVVTSNFVGTYDGTSILTAGGAETGNHKHGIYVRTGSTNNQIGLPNKGNIVGGNGYAFEDVHTKDSDPATNTYLFGVAHGITLHDDGGVTSGNKVQGNFIGYYNGNCIANRQDGISLLGFYSGGGTNGLRDNLLGGTATGEGNVIGGGMFGIFAQGPQVGVNTIQGNFIGTDSPALNNINCAPAEGGVVLQNGADQVKVGGTTANAGNYIAYIPVGFPAIAVKGDASIRNLIQHNVLHCNGGGIKLVGNGNINLGVASPTQLAVNTLGSDDKAITGITPNTTDKIDVYLADTCTAPPCQAPNGDATKAQGLKLITTINPVANTILTTRTEKGYFTFDLTAAIATTNGLNMNNVIFVARDVNSNTSEFHKCIAIALCVPPATVTITSAATFNLCQGSAATITSSLTKASGDNTPLSSFRYILYQMPAQTKVAENATGTFVVSTAGTYAVYAYNTASQEGCGKLSNTTVTVNIQAPVTPAIISQTTVGKLCVGQTNVQFAVSGQAGSTFRWTKSDDAVWTRTGTSVVIAAVTQDFTLTVVETTAAPFSCAQASVSLPVVVNPLPAVEIISGDNDVCAGETVVYSVPNKVGYTYVWSTTATDATLTPDGNQGSVKWGTTSGSIRVDITNENGCKSVNSSTLQVTVNELPVPKTITGANPVCAGSNQTYSVTGTISTYSWKQDGNTVGTTSNQLTIIIPETATTVLSVLETNAKGCVGLNPSTFTVNINKRPIPINLQALPSPNVCLGSSYQVKVDAQAGVNFIWSANPSSMILSSSSSNTLNLTATVSGTISVLATNATTGCISNALEGKMIDVNVRQLPLTPVIIGKDTIACSATEIYSVQNSKVTSAYTWYYGTDAVGSPLEGTSSALSVATIDFGARRAEIQVREIDQFGCESGLGLKNPVMIGCDPKADFSVNATSFCLGEPVLIKETATYSPPTVEPLTMWFYFTGATVDSLQVFPGGEVNVTYLSPGSYPVKMVIKQAGKEDVKDSANVVVIKPRATIGNQLLVGSNSICQNFDGTYSITTPNTGSNYTWTFPGAIEGAGSTNTAKNLSFGPSSNDVTITVFENRNGCLDTLKKVIDVKLSPKVLALNGSKSVCENEDFTITLAGAATTSTYVWTPVANIKSYNAGKTSAVLNFATAGEYIISVLETTEDGCFDIDSTTFATVTIKSIPVAPQLIGAGLNGICEGGEASFSSPLIAGYIYNWTVTAPDVIASQSANNVIIKPSGVGSKSVSLSVTNNGCTSGVTTSNYVVQANPIIPTINAGSPNYCEASEATFSVNNPVSTSNYCWSIPSGASIVTGSVCGVGNNQIVIKFGQNGGAIEVSETTNIGCVSAKGSVNANIINILGDSTDIRSYKGEICSAVANDSLASYEISVENANSITYSILPVIDADNYVMVDKGASASLEVTFPRLSEGINYTVTATAKGACDTKNYIWDVFVKQSNDIDVSIDARDVCEGDDVTYTASLSSNVDTKPSFKWTLDNKTIGTSANTVSVPNVNDGDVLAVRYINSANVCVDLDSSILSTDVAIRAYEKPSSDLIITGDKVKENFDAYNVKYYTVIGKQDIVLDAALLIHEEANSVYNYEFYWKNGSLSFYSNIETPFGIFDGADNVLSNATLDDLRNGEKVRWYVIQTDVNGICSTRDSVQIIINYGIDPINVITPSTKDENKIWTIENIEQFPGNTVVIYNRWGSIVRYYGPNEFVSWDGTNENGEELPVGTYFFTINLGDGRAPCTGPVTLLR